jgi:threonine-phosphate decarboxylase
MRQPILTHGGDWAGYQEEYGSAPLDFSSNLSPLGIPASVRSAMERAVATADRYPDPLCRRLREAIAQAEGVDAAQCLCGNGAADLIYRVAFARKPRRALVTAPTFAEYQEALDLVGCRVEHYILKEETGFLPQGDLLDAITPGLDLVFLCEPNNPTGRTTPRALLLDALERCRQVGALLVVDECFGDFLDDPAAHTVKGCLDGGNLLILKAFTKLYALAGVRLGYCLCADRALLEAMARAGQPWAVSIPAQEAGLAALKEVGTPPAVRALMGVERPWLQGKLTELGFRVTPGEANYLLFSSPVPLLEPLRRRGILLRCCGNYQGLDERWYRAAVRKRQENERLISALEEIIKEGRT